MKIPPETKPALLGIAGGAIALAIIGFSWGGWVTGSTADKAAKQRADAAVVSALLPVCVERFQASADAAAHFAALKKASSWEQGPYVEKGGWANMPGSKTANSDLARACAEALGKATQ
jgi:alpha/beta superfamily hydrolase